MDIPSDTQIPEGFVLVRKAQFQQHHTGEQVHVSAPWSVVLQRSGEVSVSLTGSNGDHITIGVSRDSAAGLGAALVTSTQFTMAQEG